MYSTLFTNGGKCIVLNAYLKFPILVILFESFKEVWKLLLS